MSRRRVVITGMGAITPVGLNAMESWQSVKNGACGIAPITHYDTSAQKVKLAAEVKGFKPEESLGKMESKRMGRFTQFAVTAAREALAAAKFDIEKADPDRCGVIISSGIGALQITEAEHVRAMNKGYDRVSPFYIPMTISNMAAGQVAIDSGFQGMCSCPVTACAGGTNAVGDAFRYIRDGYAEVMLCGGTEGCITPLAIGGFTSMKALTTAEDPNRASIPFDKERSGFVMGEGSGILLLEELEHAQKRGAAVYAEITGYGATCDAYHMTAPRPDCSGGAKAMAMALADGGAKPEDVEYINAHGTSTLLNDAGETTAVKTVFGEHAYKLAMSSTKSMTGHLLGAAGAVEAIFTALALYDGFIPATINYQVPDEKCDLDIVPNEGRSADLRYALSNSLGFGGHNGCLLLKKWEEQ
ncbi:MAG: beta-ketoacyl-ACP synthase II [Eubacterium sp.]|nr:beta-ketoacyl-ACP synthase II [Eubacterium sp.]